MTEPRELKRICRTERGCRTPQATNLWFGIMLRLVVHRTRPKHEGSIAPALGRVDLVKHAAMKFTIMNYPPCLYSASNLASQFAHILAYAAWMGSTVWTTFVAGITMMRNLPRQQFGKLQVGADTMASKVIDFVLGTLGLRLCASAGFQPLIH